MSLTGVKNITHDILVQAPREGMFSRIRRLVHSAEDRVTGDASEILLLFCSLFLIMCGLLKGGQGQDEEGAPRDAQASPPQEP